MIPKYIYYLFDGLILFSIMVILLLAFFINNVSNIFLVILISIGMIFYIKKFISSLTLLYDLVLGVEEKVTHFLGLLTEDKLDVFYKVKYNIIYLDDELLSKNYMVFEDAINEELKQGDKIHIMLTSRFFTPK